MPAFSSILSCLYALHVRMLSAVGDFAKSARSSNKYVFWVARYISLGRIVYSMPARGLYAVLFLEAGSERAMPVVSRATTCWPIVSDSKVC